MASCVPSDAFFWPTATAAFASYPVDLVANARQTPSAHERAAVAESAAPHKPSSAASHSTPSATPPLHADDVRTRRQPLSECSRLRSAPVGVTHSLSGRRLHLSRSWPSAEGAARV